MGKFIIVCLWIAALAATNVYAEVESQHHDSRRRHLNDEKPSHRSPHQNEHRREPGYRAQPSHHRRPSYRDHPRYHRPGYRKGHVVPHLPHHVIHLFLHALDYYYSDGIFYRPRRDGGYVVVSAPVGAILATLPQPYEVIWVNRRQYYTSNGVYFVEDANGFRVVANPIQISPPVTQPTEKLFIYPAKGQSEEQQSRDRYECHRWGVSQTDYDPSAVQNADSAKLADYQRAMSACLQARGYTVK